MHALDRTSPGKNVPSSTERRKRRLASPQNNDYHEQLMGLTHNNTVLAGVHTCRKGVRARQQTPCVPHTRLAKPQSPIP